MLGAVWDTREVALRPASEGARILVLDPRALEVAPLQSVSSGRVPPDRPTKLRRNPIALAHPRQRMLDAASALLGLVWCASSGSRARAAQFWGCSVSTSQAHATS